MRHLAYMKKKLKEMEDKTKEQKVKYLSGVKKQAQEQSDHKQTMDMVNSFAFRSPLLLFLYS